MFDSDGYFHLEAKIDLTKPHSTKLTIVEKPAKKKKKEKINKPKFKKGSWKHYLWKKIRDWRSSQYVEDFHFVKLENLVIYRDDSSKDKGKLSIYTTKNRLKKKQLDKLKKSDDAYVLVNTYDQMYTKIPIKSYLKLIEIDKIIFDLTLTGIDDGGDKFDVYGKTDIVDNINDLMRYVNIQRQGIEGVYDIQAACCGYTIFEFKFKIVVSKLNGEAVTYKSDMNDFMKDYGLYQF